MTNTIKMRFHVVGLPHTAATKEYAVCAFTQNVINFCKMMKSLGHEVYHYGGEGSKVDCDEQIDIITAEEREKFWGANNWRQDFFKVDFDLKKPYWKIANERAIAEIGKRIQPRDFICVIGGTCHEPIAKAFVNNMTVEFAIGYFGTFSKYRVFASYALMHYIYGKENKEIGHDFDAVIPHYFDPKDFKLHKKKDNYYAFVGRMIPNKGVWTAVAITKAIGAKLKLAGQGVVRQEAGTIQCVDGEIKGDHVQYLGTVGVKDRAKLMGKAKALFVPSKYIEPFGNVVAEAMLCGTPVIATDYGAFTETVEHGVTGFRVRTLGEAIEATKLLKTLRPAEIRAIALRKFSIEVVKYKYQAYFEQLMELWGEGWNTTKVSEHFIQRYR